MNIHRTIAATMVSLCSLTGSVLLSVPVASAVTPPVIEEEAALNVAGTSATLQARVNSQGSETTYRFEYGTSEAYGSEIPDPNGPAGSGSTSVTVEVHPQDLLPGTAYHFRVVLESAGGATVDGLDRTFTTQAVGVPFSLPDGRQWELVSPPEKYGTQILPKFHGLIEAAGDGDAISYYATGPFAGEASTGNVEVSQALSLRGGDGWSTQDIAPPHSKVSIAGNQGPEYQVFSPDLSSGIVEEWGSSPLSPEATERTIYLREDATGIYRPLVTAANVKPGVEFGGHEQVGEGLFFIAASPDLTHVVLATQAQLTSENSTEASLRVTGAYNYYEWVNGALHLINVLPANAPSNLRAGQSASIGEPGGSGGNENTRDAVSEDGSRIFWTAEVGNGRQLYMRDVPVGESVRVNAAQGVAEPARSSAAFQIASRDGNRVFFGDSEQLTTAPGGGLYVYEVETGMLTLLTVPLNSGEAPGVAGEGGSTGVVMGASEDGTYVYVVATGVLSANENDEHEKAVSGAENLYVLHSEARGRAAQWTTTFVAGLSNEDGPSWDQKTGSPFLNLRGLTSRVSPNGRYLAFMSDRSLTGYDNVDAHGGQRDEEVYEYDAVGNRLVCASCNPTGARPEGGIDQQSLVDPTGVWGGHWVAASIPGWIEADRSFAQPRYQSRYLSDTGRLFFDSLDGLVPTDVNGTEDVYQYEPSGVGSCVTVGGCVSLISAGTGPSDSVFADASTSGEDVFFVTQDRLVREDADTGYDMYDAHVCRSSAPCFPAVSAPPPPCVTADSCKPAPSPQPTIFGAPASATFSGAGNLAPPVVKPAVTVRSVTLARALRACHRERNRRRRTVCERKVRRQYGKQAAHRASRSKARGKTSRGVGR